MVLVYSGGICDFYHKRFKKILVPYYVTLIVAVICLILFARSSFDFLGFAGALLCRTSIAGGEHLWFVSTILLCYVITPILSSYREKVKSRSEVFLFALLFVFVTSVSFGLYGGYFSPACMSCYVIGYWLGVNEDKKLISVPLLIILFGALAVIGNSLQIYCDYIAVCEFPGHKGTLYGYFRNYNHVWLGVFLFLTMREVFKKWNLVKIKKILNFSDNYSYEVYLVHQFLILGPMSLMAITPILGLNILIILIGIGILAWLLKTTEEKLIRLIP